VWRFGFEPAPGALTLDDEVFASSFDIEFFRE
jgi:hypothetical protein